MVRNVKFRSEKEMGAAVVAWLQGDGWDVFQEVRFAAFTGVADVVAVRDARVWIIELKQALTLDLLGQAEAWTRTRYPHYVSVCSGTAQAHPMFLRLCAGLRVGVLRASQWGVVQERPPPLLRTGRYAVAAAVLRPEHRTMAAAGSQGGFYTPFKQTCVDLLRVVLGSPGLTMKEALARMTHHYRNDTLARNTLPKRIRQGLVPGVEARDMDGALRLYPTTNNGKV